jgi:molybdate transport system regulatory protein
MCTGVANLDGSECGSIGSSRASSEDDVHSEEGRRAGLPLLRPARRRHAVVMACAYDPPMAEQRGARLVPRLRVLRGADILLGPGKADLLEAIGRLGSLRDAASELDMSYMRAWKLVQTMNEGFREPLVLFHRGGPDRGGAELSETGRTALRLYQSMEAESMEAMKRSWQQLRKLVR